jgi:hypothetical protein
MLLLKECRSRFFASWLDLETVYLRLVRPDCDMISIIFSSSTQADIHAKHITCIGIGIPWCTIGAPLVGALHVCLAPRLSFQRILKVFLELPSRLVVHLGIRTHLQAVGFPFEEHLLRADRVDSQRRLEFAQYIVLKFCVWCCEELVDFCGLILHDDLVVC